MIESLEDLHLAPNTLFIPFDLLLRDDLQRDLMSDSRRRLARCRR